MYGALIPKEMINHAIKDSKSYKTYLAYATGASTPKKARKFKKPALPSKKQTIVLEDKPAKKSKWAVKSVLAKEDVSFKKPSRKKSFGVVIRDTSGVSVSKKKAPAKVDRGKGMDLLSDVALLKADQLKKVLKRSNQDTHMLHASGSDDRFGSQPKVSNELQDKTTSRNEGTDDDSNDNDNDDDNDGDGKNVESDVTKEEYGRINEELYGDVNVSLKDAKPANKEKGNVEMTVAGQVNVNQEGEGNQVKDDAHATQKTEGPILSSSISFDYAAKYLNFDNIPSVDTKVSQSTTSTIVVSEIEYLAAFHQRITNLEKDVTKLKTDDHSAALLPTINFEVPNAVKEYLRTSLDDALHKVLRKHDVDIIKEHSVPDEIKRKQDEADKDGGPIIGSDRWLKRQKTSKDVEPSKKANSIETSKGTSKSQPESNVKSAQAEETVFEAGDT
nr:hypothetical protein [Tanacetum cinerariifolium]